MNSFEKLTEIFRQFPGIGPRQAKRFVYFLLTRDKEYLSSLISSVENLKKENHICAHCKRFYSDKKQSKLCQICADTTRDNHVLMIVSQDVDLDNIEKSHSYHGKYFVLGGTLPILEKNPEKYIRAKDLATLIKQSEFSEIILALSANPEGEHTVDFLDAWLKKNTKDIKLSKLGRGLSTGTELEYSDSETIKAALQNRA